MPTKRLLSKILVLTLLIPTLLAPIPAQAAGNVLYVAPLAVGSENCATWADACTLQAALSNSISGDQIWVKTGIHHPGSDRAASFALKNGVAIYGGFAGDETALVERTWSINVTVLSGDIDGDDITDANGVVTSIGGIVGNNNYHVVTSSATDASAVLDGFFITAGQANGIDVDSSGGGIYNDTGSPSLTNVNFSGNFAIFGGGMHNNNGSPTLVNITFLANEAGTDGGGMRSSAGNPSLNNVTFNLNTAGDYGGGMHNNNSSPILTNVTFDENNSIYGGGMSNIENSAPSLTNAAFINNTAQYGGGIFNNTNSNPTLTKATFLFNTAGVGGGGIYNVSSSPTITNVIFSANAASGTGGGLRNYENSNPTLRNVTFYNNNSAAGGGMANRNTSTPTLVNTILWGNTASDGPQIHNAVSSFANATYSIVQSGWPGIGNINADPLFVNASGGSLHLTASSPAIDSGSNTSCATTDLDGKSRPKDGNHDGFLVCDIGAYEFSETFADVPSSYWAWDYIERLSTAGITGGCGNGNYCPESPVTRAQMAIFLERGMNDSSFVPPPANGTVFGDVPASYWAAAWVEQLATDGVTGGCGGGNYCPENPVTRAQMAIFLLRAKYGSSYAPPAVGSSTGFGDVPASYWAASWIKQLAAEGITGGCGSGNYCPDQAVNRGQMAVFLVRTFGLP